MRLLADIAQGRIIQSLAAEGGLHSTLWAGPESFSRAMKKGAAAGPRHRAQSVDQFEARLFRRRLRLRHRSRPADTVLHLSLPAIRKSRQRANGLGETLTRQRTCSPCATVRAFASATKLVHGGRCFTHSAPFDSMMTHCSDPRDAPELLLLRERMRDWRFYDHFSTDRDAPAREPQIGTYTPVLGSDGSDLAAAMQTIREIGNARSNCDEAIADAFPRLRSIEIANSDGYFELADVAAWPAASAEGGRAFRRHAALSAPGRRAVVAAAADADGPQRAGDERRVIRRPCC